MDDIDRRSIEEQRQDGRIIWLIAWAAVVGGWAYAGVLWQRGAGFSRAADLASARQQQLVTRVSAMEASTDRDVVHERQAIRNEIVDAKRSEGISRQRSLELRLLKSSFSVSLLVATITLVVVFVRQRMQCR